MTSRSRMAPDRFEAKIRAATCDERWWGIGGILFFFTPRAKTSLHLGEQPMKSRISTIVGISALAVKVLDLHLLQQVSSS